MPLKDRRDFLQDVADAYNKTYGRKPDLFLNKKRGSTKETYEDDSSATFLTLLKSKMASKMAHIMKNEEE